MKVVCFGCKRWARKDDCTLKEHKESCIRRWFHKPEVKANCMSWLHPEDWLEVDPALGETTDEELHSWKAGEESSTVMKCCDCRFVSAPEIIGKGKFPSVRCTLGLWDSDNKAGAPQWYSYGSLVRNRGPIRRHGEACTKGEFKQ